MKTRNTTCPYCGVGCGVTAEVADSNLISTSGDVSHPANQGRLCSKGTHLNVTPVTSARLAVPHISGKPCDWDAALDAVASGLQDTAKTYGPEAIAFYLSGQLLTEDYYVANKLMKGFLGSANVDTNSRLCMASAVAAHKRAFGEDVVPCTYADIDTCSLIILAGSNAAWTHPVLFQRLAERQQKGQLKVVVIDPRRTPTCDIADLHLALRPGSDVALFNGLLTYLADHHQINNTFINHNTNDYAKALATCRLNLPEVAAATQLSLTDITQFYAMFSQHEQSVTLFSQGINQSAQGTDKANTIINCHLATGRIGTPGAGPFSITGQPNAMGGREVGGMANQLAAHMDFDAHHVELVGRFWQAPNMATKPGLKAMDMFQAIRRGQIKAVWIMGTNPAVSLPQSSQVRQALTECPLVIVSDCAANTDTTRYAHIQLPALAWGEKDGTVTNSERCISRQRRLLPPFRQARADWQIVCQVAARMGFASAFSYEHSADVFREHALLTRLGAATGRQLDLTHLSNLTRTQYDNLSPTYWPAARAPFADGRFSTDNGRANFVGVQQAVNPDANKTSHGLILNSGRLRDQWHTMSRTGLAAKLFQHVRYPYLELHPDDAQTLEITDCSLTQVCNEHGAIRLLARLNEAMPRGQVFAPIHWNDQFASNACVSKLYGSAADPHSGQPASKYSRVSCRPIGIARWCLLTTATVLPREAFDSRVEFWATTPVNDAWQYLIAVEDEQSVWQALPHVDVAACQIGASRSYRARVEDQVVWTLYAADAVDQLPPPELAAHYYSGHPDRQADWLHLSAQSNRTNNNTDTSALVCTCFEVREEQIFTAITQGKNTLAELGETLRCGTNCGSCRPELNELLQRHKRLHPQRLVASV